MTEMHQIRKLYFNEGQSITQIARQTGRDRKTIRLYLEKEDWNPAPPPAEPEMDFPKLSPFKALIDAWLQGDKKAKRKQRHTAMRIFHRLEKETEGKFNCSYRTVAAYVAQAKQELYGQRRGYLPLEHIPGEAQGDFGEAQFFEGDQLYTGKYFNLSFPCSNQGYLQLYKGENQECLFEGLLAIFTHIGGVPLKIWFDNTKTIVTKVIKGGGRLLTEDFLRFQEHYRFEAVFCNVEAGHEKGSVENKVGYHRRNLLVPVPRFTDLTRYNQELLARCDQDGAREHYRKEATIAQLYAADMAALLPLPSVPLDVSQYLTVRANGYGRFYLENGLHEYSVSPQYAGSRVRVKITASEVLPLDKNGRMIVRHNRLYGSQKQQSMQWLPYLTQLSRNPNALKYSGVYPLLPESLKEYLARCNSGDKGKILQMIAALTGKSGFEKALDTVTHALQYAAADIDSLLSLHLRLYDQVPELAPLHLTDSVPQLEPIAPDLKAYDARLAQGGGPSC